MGRENFFLLLLMIFLGSSSNFALISSRFVPANSTATLSGALALWANPSGLAFMDKTQLDASYLYEFSDFGHRHHGMLSLATSPGLENN